MVYMHSILLTIIAKWEVKLQFYKKAEWRLLWKKRVVNTHKM